MSIRVLMGKLPPSCVFRKSTRLPVKSTCRLGLFRQTLIHAWFKPFMQLSSLTPEGQFKYLTKKENFCLYRHRIYVNKRYFLKNFIGFNASWYVFTLVLSIFFFLLLQHFWKNFTVKWWFNVILQHAGDKRCHVPVGRSFPDKPLFILKQMNTVMITFVQRLTEDLGVSVKADSDVNLTLNLHFLTRIWIQRTNRDAGWKFCNKKCFFSFSFAYIAEQCFCCTFKVLL